MFVPRCYCYFTMVLSSSNKEWDSFWLPWLLPFCMQRFLNVRTTKVYQDQKRSPVLQRLAQLQAREPFGKQGLSSSRNIFGALSDCSGSCSPHTEGEPHGKGWLRAVPTHGAEKRGQGEHRPAMLCRQEEKQQDCCGPAGGREGNGLGVFHPVGRISRAKATSQVTIASEKTSLGSITAAWGSSFSPQHHQVAG